MKRIALIPIDNRPVCYDLPKMTAEINSDIKLFLPNRNFLGDLHNNANTEALFEWLEDLENVDYIIISADTLIYGGLIPSRRSCESEEETEKKLLRLRNILLKKSNCKTLIFSSIMRISNNNINEEEKEYWSEWGTKLFEYSYNYHKAEVEGSIESKKISESFLAEIPQEIIIDWLTTRERNFLINKEYLKFYDDGIINTLVYSKDDCAEYGFNVKEGKYLEFEANKRKGVFVKTGADEIPLTLLARCIADGEDIKIAPVYTRPDEINLKSNYEDISVEQSVNSQIQTAGARVTSVDKADMILYVNNFKNNQGELVMGIDTESFKGKFLKFKKPYFIADIVNANGSDNAFVKTLFENKTDEKFLGYAAWNTTGNTLGSAISCAVSFYTAKKNPNKTAFKKLQAVRFLDDWAYQSNLRNIIKNNFPDDSGNIQKMFEDYEEQIQKFLGMSFRAEYSFPWNRTFETEVKLYDCVTEKY